MEESDRGLLPRVLAYSFYDVVGLIPTNLMDNK